MPSTSTTKMRTTCRLSYQQSTNLCLPTFPRARVVASVPNCLSSAANLHIKPPHYLSQFHLLLLHQHLPWDHLSSGNVPPPLMRMDMLWMSCPQQFILEGMRTPSMRASQIIEHCTLAPHPQSPHHPSILNLRCTSSCILGLHSSTY